MIHRLIAVLVLSLCAPLIRADSGIFPQYPSLTPDGSFVIFSWAGDLWAVPATGGAASRLTSHPGDDLASAVSPDGSLLAFESTREGAKNIYLADLAERGGTLVASNPRRLTVADSGHNLSGFNADGSAVLFSSYMERDIYREERMYAAPTDGGPVLRLTDAYGEHPSMTHGGGSVVFCRGSNNGVRPLYRGPATGELWRLDLADGAFTRLTDDRNDDIQPSALPDGSVVFISSADRQYNVWRIGPNGGKPEQLTAFKPTPEQYTIAHGVRDLAVSADGSTAAFCVYDTLYTLDLTKRGAEPKAVSVTVSDDSDALDRIDLDKDATEAVLSPDGQTVAVVARGEVFIRATAKDRPTRRVTHSEAREQHVAWSPDGTRLYFVSDIDGPPSIYAATVALSRTDLDEDDEAEQAEEAA
ncbi:MAG TPA: hypothetical protein ENK11_00600, partial [Phycisphaerales bacterium]|nr:hypothetical protein [Phycisphaerales bacterium]